MEIEMLSRGSGACKDKDLELLKKTWNEMKLSEKSLNNKEILKLCEQRYLNNDQKRERVWEAFLGILRETDFSID
jgi:hypothetical protein